MKDVAQRNWKGINPGKKNSKLELDQATVLGSLTLLIFAYIIFRFIYPLVEKGVLW